MLQDVDQFLSEMSGRWTAETIARYGWFLRHLADWLVNCGLPDNPSQITKSDLVAWLNDQANWSRSTRYLAVTACRQFFRWAVGDRKSPARFLVLPKRQKTRHRYLNEKQVEALLASLDTSTVIGVRNTALILLMLDTGLRSSEVCRLKLRDLDVRGRNLDVPVKGGGWARAVFSAYTATALDLWLAWRPKVAAKDTTTVFCGIKGAKPGTRLTRDGLRVICRKIGERAGFHFSPHDLRRTCGTWAIKRGASTRMVQILLRLKTLALVEVYSPGVQPEDLDPYSPVNTLMEIPESPNGGSMQEEDS